MESINTFFLGNQYQRVVLSGKTSYWSQVEAAVPRGSILGPLSFLGYINDLPKGLNSSVKQFVDDTSLFSVVHDPRVTIETLNEVLSKVSQWAHQWEMLFNPNSSKQAKEIVFSRKNRATNYGNVSIINSENVLKHLGLSLHVRLNFVENTNAQIKKANKGISVLRKFHLSINNL